MNEIKFRLSCADCAVINCDEGDKMYPQFCLTTHLDEEILKDALSCYEEESNKKIMKSSAEVEFEGYCRLTRIEEVMLFAQKIGARKLGIATCVGLINETRTLAKILRSNGFEVYGIGCKVGTVPKIRLGIDECCTAIGENICNPILQAKLLNAEKTDLNIVMGLCVGHDSLFYKYSEAPATTIVTKDRVLGHNPVAALYTSGTYYSKLYKKEE